ncbi:MAG: inositol monophosphatase, partial [Chloroflexi bacterium]|nr:inositol monophosphatase [Chloroflexota bacterium]
AIDIAKEAGAIALSYFDTERVGTRAKGERDVVTAADLASEQLMVRRLTEAFPGDGIVAEEGSRVGAAGERRWFLDPVDGTVNYARGVHVWCVSLSLFEGKYPLLGVIHDPIRGETFSALRGQGARCNDRPIVTSGIAKPSSALVHITVDFHDDSQLLGLEDVRALAPRVFRTRNIGSAALALAYIAAGRLDGMVHRLANTWDYGAGVLLVQEAGGRATSIGGEEYTDTTRALLAAATPELHRALFDILRGVGGSPLQ